MIFILKKNKFNYHFQTYLKIYLSFMISFYSKIEFESNIIKKKNLFFFLFHFKRK
jgi:hypothetical protein